MNRNWALAGAIITFAMSPWMGQAGERPVFRAQGPVYSEGYPAYHDGMIYEDCDECDDDHCGPCFGVSHCWNYLITLGGRPGDHYSRGVSSNRYLYRYNAPQNLVYPAANQPAGVVVYPYYTVKGPDDFFLQ